ncbi:MAG: c(7)-type cytochrome triheme domain-containing protein [Candidatus Binatia bacterium]
MRQRDLGLILLTGGWIALFTGCSAESRHNILSTIFDGVDSPPPPTRRVRRDLLREIEELKRQLAEAQEAAKSREGDAGDEEVTPPVEQARNWEKALELLPKDQAGHADWVQALEGGTIAPRPGIGPKTPEQAVLDLDLELSSSGNKLFTVKYPHAPHTQWLACKNCHPAIFPLKRQGEPTVITMAKINDGQYCGVCHGKVAFGTEGRCARCHTKIPAKGEWQPPEKAQKPIELAATWEEAAKLLPVRAGSADWAKALADGVIAPRPGIDPKASDQPVLPLDVERVPAAGQMFKAIFPHKAHTTWLSCTNCHPAIFQMVKGANSISMEKINAGKYCGVCHGKVAFPVTACGRCHPAMSGGQ